VQLCLICPFVLNCFYLVLAATVGFVLLICYVKLYSGYFSDLFLPTVVFLKVVAVKLCIMKFMLMNKGTSCSHMSSLFVFVINFIIVQNFILRVNRLGFLELISHVVAV